MFTRATQWGSSTPDEREERIEELELFLKSIISAPEKERDLEMQLRILKRLAEIYLTHGDFQKSIAYAHEQVELSRHLLGEDHLMTGGAYNDLGLVLLNSERFPEAETYLSRALAIARNSKQQNGESISLCLSNLAIVCLHQSKRQEAKKLLQESLKIQQGRLTVPHLSTAYSLSQLAGIEQIEGHYQEAADYQQQALFIFRALLPESHVDIAIGVNNLATIYYQQGKLLEAEKLFNEALTIAIPVLGEDHPTTKMMWNVYRDFQQEKGVAPALP
ncbi:MAG: tetratricopeptide repeat protein [Chthonomonadaceae bacterium]|nr:tetratricopeptide repeat protein [Chthonomonadaceae bacterium]